LNKPELIRRSITGIGIVAVTLAVIILSPYSYLIWLGLISLVGTIEFFNLKKSDKKLGLITGFLFAALIILTGISILEGQNPLYALALLPLAVSLSMILRLMTDKEPAALAQSGNNLFASAMYTGIPLLCGCLFLFGKYQFQFILVPVILIWINDVGAYLTGSLWGSKKIVPSISPGKSLQGTVGGAILTFIAAFVLWLCWPFLPYGYIIAVGIATPFLSLSGDLWESSLKRVAGVKDSGNILPGHGGILDRYDSLLFVLPFAALAYCIFVL
jgi:phosphatidate cytidylyltransferase